ncbi:MAG: hypothetical protein ACRCVX_12450 [Shewanella sp.]
MKPPTWQAIALWLKSTVTLIVGQSFRSSGMVEPANENDKPKPCDTPKDHGGAKERRGPYGVDAKGLPPKDA